VGALDDAYAEARRRFGRRASKWDYGKMRETVIPNLVLNQLPQIGAWFNVGPVPMSGAGTTVKQVVGRLMPSMRYVADLSDWDNSLANVPVGQSGHALSPHYRDQWNNHYVGTSRPMQFNKVQVEHTLTVRP
jgi:penicillin amidase